MTDSHFRTVELQAQYALLRQPGNCPEGVFVTPSPSIDEWSGIIFVRKGYYKGCILRFRIGFPAGYPLRAPTVHFAKGSLIHPLVDTRDDRLALSSSFPEWNPRTDSVPKLLFFVKGIFKDYNLSKLNDGLAVNGEAWRLYQSNRAVFAKLATQCASISSSPGNLYALPNEGNVHTVNMANDLQAKKQGQSDLTFRELSEEEEHRVRQALFSIT